MYYYTRRIATDFMSSSEWNHITDVQHLESIITSKGLTFLNAGLAFSSETLQAIPQLIQQTTCTSVSYNMSDAFDLKEALDVAEVVLKVSKLTDGKGNFRFCAAAHTDGYAIPFFPAASACAATSGSFAIGLENGRYDLVPTLSTSMHTRVRILNPFKTCVPRIGLEKYTYTGCCRKLSCSAWAALTTSSTS